MIGELRFDPRCAELRRADDSTVPLRPLASRALALLVERRGRLVSHRSLRQALWGDDAIDWENGIYQVVRQLRRTLDPPDQRSSWIETVPRRGYRLRPAPPASPVESSDASAAATKRRPLPWFPRDRRDVALMASGAVGLVAAVVLGCWLLAV